MKKCYLPYILILPLLLIQSCEKEDSTQTHSEFQTQYEGKYFSEIKVYDYTGKNSVIFVVSSDDECLLYSFVDHMDFELLPSEEPITEQDFHRDLSLDKMKEANLKYYSLDQEPKLFITKLCQNLTPEVRSFQLGIKEKKDNVTSVKCPNFIAGYPLGFSGDNWDSFLGIAWMEWGYDIAVNREYKPNWYSLWQDYGSTYWLGCVGYACCMSFSSYKKRLTVYPHHYQVGVNYRVAYSQDDYRGASCSLGTFDNYNCYIGTPPSGTTAFMWPNNTGAHYYTPVSGNQCPYKPYPESGFDGANCYVVDIPTSNPGFIYQNKFYVLTDLL